MEHKYRISVHLGGSGFEIESTDLEWVERKEREYLTKFEEHKPNVRKPDGEKATPPSSLTQSLTIHEYYRNQIKDKVKSRSDIAVFFMYYLQKIQKRDGIKTSDIAQCFQDVSYPKYNKLNVTDILNQGKHKALLNYVNAFWSLTITGEDFVLNLLASPEK